MKQQDIWSFENHQKYLKYHFNLPSSKRGERLRWSQFLAVQPSFVSQVLVEKLALSLEQAEATNEFLNHTPEESEFFILLTSRDRAGSKKLKQRYTNQIENIRAHRKEVVDRLGKRSGLSLQSQSIYYSSWLYSAVHVASTIPSLHNMEALAKRLNLEKAQLLKIVEFLAETGLVQWSAGEIQSTNNWVRTDRSSPFIGQMHRNWRDVATRNLEKATADDLHYSGIYSTDAKTAQAFRDFLLDNLKTGLKEIEISKEEDLYVLGVDFFNLKK